MSQLAISPKDFGLQSSSKYLPGIGLLVGYMQAYIY